MTQPFTLALIQTLGSVAKADRFHDLIGRLEKVAHSGCEIAVLPELFLEPYFPIEESVAHFDRAHDVRRREMVEIREVARRLEITIVVPFFEKEAPGIYFNSLVVFDQRGRVAGHYRKMHIPHDPSFFEKYYFAPGNLGYVTIPTKSATIGTLICWDQWFPEAARLTASQGAELLIYPTAIGWDRNELASLSPAEAEDLKARQCEAWKTIQRSHAIANGVFVAAVNRVGTEGHLDFWGNSFVCGPEGELIDEAGIAEEDLTISLNRDRIDQVRRVWPFWRDRRIDTYERISRRFGDESSLSQSTPS